jgi:thiosulfate dehydrogenase
VPKIHWEDDFSGHFNHLTILFFTNNTIRYYKLIKLVSSLAAAFVLAASFPLVVQADDEGLSSTSGSVNSADTSIGRRLATEGLKAQGIEPCASCHQADGGGNEDVAAPRLAAINAGYLTTQINNFKNGNRQHAMMVPWAKLLTKEQIASVSAYYESLPPAGHAQVPQGIDMKVGESLALYGDWANRRLPACVQCHGPLGIGAGEAFPALAGQPYNYLYAQLRAWAKGQRKGDPMGMMHSVSKRLSAPESKSLAAYFASLSAEQAPKMATKVKRGEMTSEATIMTIPTVQQAKPVSIHNGELAHHGEVPEGRDPGKEGYFEPPMRDNKPEKQFGEMVKLGEAIFSNTYSHEVSGKYVGNTQTCQGCHLDTGRLANSAPMWASWVAYPDYRKKTKSVNTMIERVQGCFKYSMNAQASKVGHPPSAQSTTIHALLSYMYWLSTGAPTGDKSMPGRGYPKLAETKQGFDPQRGAVVYAKNCAICHGPDGKGGWTNGEMVFPPLWGDRSYNWGAGMHKINTAAAFIKANMPLGNYIKLTDQEAWDVAAFINAQERPQDPRFNGDLAETTKQFHSSKFDYYGKRKGPDGKLLGQASRMSNK